MYIYNLETEFIKFIKITGLDLFYITFYDCIFISPERSHINGL